MLCGCCGRRETGEGRDRNGKLWRWEFSPYFGPLFLRADGEPLARQPIAETHPAWEPFMRWHEEKHPKKPKAEEAT